MLFQCFFLEQSRFLFKRLPEVSLSPANTKSLSFLSLVVTLKEIHSNHLKGKALNIHSPQLKLSRRWNQFSNYYFIAADIATITSLFA